MRITDAKLKQLLERINNHFGYTDLSYGSYTLEYAYGGVQLTKINDNNTGTSNVSTYGYGTKKEMYRFMQGFIKALNI
jgi:hypothetical protein